MHNPRGIFLLVLAAFLAGCASTTSPFPLTDTPPPAASSSSVFAGHARAFRFVQETWVAAPEYDYDFLVLERRFADHWEAIKEIHRRHPRYDGRAGPRDQTLYFFIRMSPPQTAATTSSRKAPWATARDTRRLAAAG